MSQGATEALRSLFERSPEIKIGEIVLEPRTGSFAKTCASILCWLVRRILRKHGYPPDKQEPVTRTVLEQAEALSVGWAV